MGPLYGEYGLSIIGKYPVEFLKYFIWPNTCKYYSLPVEFLQCYNSCEITAKKPAVQWFEYKTSKISTRTKSLHVTILNYYPILTGAINLIYLFSLLCLISLKFFKFRSATRASILLAATFWLTNASFTIFCSSAALRFQAFPVVITTVFALTMVELMCKMALQQDKKHSLSSMKMTDHNRDSLSAFT